MTNGWQVAMGDGYSFEIVETTPRTSDPHGDAWLNGSHPTKLSAIESCLENLEANRRELNIAIASAKRMRRTEVQRNK